MMEIKILIYTPLIIIATSQLSPYDVLARCKNSKGSTVQCVVHRCTRFTRSRTVFCNSDRSFALSLLLLLLQVLSCSP